MIPFAVLATFAGLFFGFILAEVVVREAIDRGWAPSDSLKQNRAVLVLRNWPFAYLLVSSIGGATIAIASGDVWALLSCVFGAGAVISFVLLLRTLRDTHRETWVALGKPDPYRGSRDPRLGEFLWSGGYRKVQDRHVRQLAIAVRILFVAFPVSLLVFALKEAIA